MHMFVVLMVLLCATSMAAKAPAPTYPLDTHRKLHDAAIPPLARSPTSLMGRRGDNRPSAEIRAVEAARFQGEYGWVFTKYVPSQLEAAFISQASTFENNDEAAWNSELEKLRPQLTRLIEESEGRTTRNKYTEYVDSERACAQCFASTEVTNAEIFSYFEYEFRCMKEPCNEAPAGAPAVGSKHRSYIEPLVGSLLSPKSFLNGDFNKRTGPITRDHYIVDQWALHNRNGRWQRSKATNSGKVRMYESHYFDAGALTFSDPNGGQEWFTGLAECVCTPFSAMHLWEPQSVPARVAFSKVPEYLHPSYQWMNTVFSVEEASWRNPLNHVLELVNPEDTCIVKMQTPSTPSARYFMATIVKDTSRLSHLLDDVFIMHPVKFGVKSGGASGEGLTEALSLFTQLRNLGYRAHAWL